MFDYAELLFPSIFFLVKRLFLIRDVCYDKSSYQKRVAGKHFTLRGGKVMNYYDSELSRLQQEIIEKKRTDAKLSDLLIQQSDLEKRGGRA